MAEAIELNENQRKYLLDVVDSLVFVDDEKIVSNYKCINCKQIAIKHNAANCKHIFCSNCIRDMFDKACPVCENVTIITVNREDQFEKELFNLKVHCLYKEHGCLTVMPLYKLEEHGNQCNFSIKALLPRIYRGLRVLSEEANLRDDIHQMKTTVTDMCKTMKTMNQHLENMASKVKVPEEIVKDSDSPQLQKKMKLAHEDEVMETQEQRASYMDEEDRQHTVFFWKITAFKQRLEKLKNLDLQEIKSELFCDTDSGIRFRARLFLTSTGPHVNAQNLAIGLEWHPSSRQVDHARKYTLIDQSDRPNMKHVGFIDYPYFRYTIMTATTAPKMLKCVLAPVWLLDNDSYVKGNAVLIKISIVPLALMYKSVVPNTGDFLWPIKNYSVKKRDEVHGFRRCLASKVMNTSLASLKVQANLYLNGEGQSKGKFISIYLVLLIGQYDDGMLVSSKVTFNVEVKISLLDQTDTPNKQDVSNYFTYNANTPNNPLGRHDFVLQSKAEEAAFLKDDTLLFKFEIKNVRL